jgi:deoxycytidylate deaminase
LAAAHNTPNRHAEKAALEQLWPSKRRGTTLLCVRVNAQGELCMAKPCSDCWEYLVANGVRSVIFTNEAGELELLRVRG